MAVTVQTSGAVPAAVLEVRSPPDVDAHPRDEPGDNSSPSDERRQIPPSPDRTYQYSSMVRNLQARPTMPGGTVA